MDGIGARTIALAKRLRLAAKRDGQGLNEAHLLVHRALTRILLCDPELTRDGAGQNAVRREFESLHLAVGARQGDLSNAIFDQAGVQ